MRQRNNRKDVGKAKDKSPHSKAGGACISTTIFCSRAWQASAEGSAYS
jgi:hypothetical protein